MNLPLHQILPGEPVPLYAQNVDYSCSILASCRNDVGNNSNTPATLRIHSLYPLSKLRISERCPANVKSVHPYGTSNLLFLILVSNIKGKGREGQEHKDNVDNATYKIVLWDDRAEETVLELTFRDPVLNIVLRPDKLVVVLERRVVLFHLDLDNQDRAEAIVREGEYETVSNPLGLASIATTIGSTLLAFPGRQVGHVQLIRLPPLVTSTEPSRPVASSTNPRSTTSTAPPPYPIIHIFQAHESPLRTLTLSKTGSLLCTSSNKGTLLRVFSTTGNNKSLIRELRRGTDQADIWSVAFLHPDKGEMIACASDKRTVHVWKVGDLALPYTASTSGGAASSTSSTSSQSKGKEQESTIKAFNYLLKPYLPAYFSSQWSDLSWRIPHNASVTFQASHVAALAEQDDNATCFFVDSSDITHKLEREEEGKRKKRNKKGPAETEDPFYLLVITRSGAWYKLAIPQASPSDPSKTTSTPSFASGASRNRKVSIQDDRGNIRPSTTSRKPSAGSSAIGSVGISSSSNAKEEKDSEEDAKKCRLVEYKRIGYGSDGDEENDEEDGDVHISESESEGEEDA